ncbi:MAG: iron-sulfur cluster assembly accessory protein [Myxococcota bacterium]|nr:iron-sulfur cluster assembly accessory protein [Myxococcota bacterium]
MTATAKQSAPSIAAPATVTTPAPAPTISKKEVAVTLSAAEEIAKQKAKRGTPSARIRIGVRGGGCTGFTYVFEWADEVRPTDKEFAGPPLADGSIVSIVVDPKSLVYLGGMELDFVKGMMGHGFKFNNPNAKGACGCGESVQF